MRTTTHIRKALLASVNDIPDHAIVSVVRDLRDAVRLLVKARQWVADPSQEARKIDAFLKPKARKGGV